MSDQEVDTTQTEPQDLSVKRPRLQDIQEDKREDNQQTAEPPNETNSADCDSTTNNKTPEKKANISDAIVRYITGLYEKKVFWDEIYDGSESSEVFESIRKSLTFKEVDIEEVIKNKDKRKVVVNCDIDLKHLLTKLKFINELQEGLINKTKNKINSYQMKDFNKE